MFLKPGERHPKGSGCCCTTSCTGSVVCPCSKGGQPAPGPCWHSCTLQVRGRGPSPPVDFDSLFVESLCQAVDPRPREKLINEKESMKSHQADLGTGGEAEGLSFFILEMRWLSWVLMDTLLPEGS